MNPIPLLPYRLRLRPSTIWLGLSLGPVALSPPYLPEQSCFGTLASTWRAGRGLKENLISLSPPTEARPGAGTHASLSLTDLQCPWTKPGPPALEMALDKRDLALLPLAGTSPKSHLWPEDSEQSYVVPSEGFSFLSWQVLARTV